MELALDPRKISQILGPVLVAVGVAASTSCESRDQTAHGDASSKRAGEITARAAARSTPTATGRIPALDPSSRNPTSGVEHLDLDSLPTVTPETCSGGGHGRFIARPRSLWKPILDVVRRGWPEDEPYPPRTCVTAVRTLCGPDLDGSPGAELLAELSYRVPQEGISETSDPLHPACGSNDRVDQTVVIALSPSAPGDGSWKLLGAVGFSVRSAGEGGTVIRFKRFVRLPDGSTGLYARALTVGFTAQDDVILVHPKDGWHWRRAIVIPVPLP